MSEKLAKILQLGNKVKVFINEGNPNNRLIHIRAIVDGDQVVYKYWRKHKQYWQYAVESTLYFELQYNDGWLTIVGVDNE